MSRVIYKYPLPPGMQPNKPFTITMPADAEFLTVQMQGAGPVLWAAVTPEASPVDWKFVGVWTGDVAGGMPDEASYYLGTCTDMMGLVWHIFTAD